MNMNKTLAQPASLLCAGLLVAVTFVGCEQGTPTSPQSSTPPSAGAAPATAPANDAAESATQAPSTEAASTQAASTQAQAAEPAAGSGQDAPAGKRVSVEGVSFELPAGWSQGPARQMRLATLTDGTAEIVVSKFPAKDGVPVGGLLANVNRFRGQAQLPPLASDAAAEKLFTEADVAGRKVRVLDLKGEQSRNVVAMVPAEGSFFYFRMTGGSDVVGSRREAFDRLLQTVRVE